MFILFICIAPNDTIHYLTVSLTVLQRETNSFHREQAQHWLSHFAIIYNTWSRRSLCIYHCDWHSCLRAMRWESPQITWPRRTATRLFIACVTGSSEFHPPHVQCHHMVHGPISEELLLIINVIKFLNQSRIRLHVNNCSTNGTNVIWLKSELITLSIDYSRTHFLKKNDSRWILLVIL